MKKAVILHNPGAGDEGHDHREIIEMVESLGFECRYLSTKENFKKKIHKDNDLIVVAGGDGTVRKLSKVLLTNQDTIQQPIYLLPKGTANNIAYTLNVKDSKRHAVPLIKGGNTMPFDVWHFNKVKGLNFFIEALGFGLFPSLISEMRHIDKRYKDEPEKKLDLAVDKLHILTHEFPLEKYEIYADGKNYSGNYLMVELMNIKSIGPNFILSKEADPSDGLLDLVLIGESERDAVIKHLKARSLGKRTNFNPEVIRAKDITITTNAKFCHADDEIIELKKKHKFKISQGETPLRFITR